MIKIIVDIELANEGEAVAELEHIASLINGGYSKGEGWHISGENEASDKELPEEREYKDDEELLDDILNNR